MSDILDESPELIPISDFGMDDADTHAKIIGKLEPKSKLFDKYYEYTIYKSGNHFYSMLDNKRITYLMVLKDDKIRRLNMPYATQVLVWRLTGISKAGLSSYMFWNCVFGIHNIVMSDEQQTKDGKRFWLDRISEAFDKKFFVYGINVSTGKILRITRTNLFDVVDSEMYGVGRSFRDRRLVISRKDIFEEKLTKTT